MTTWASSFAVDLLVQLSAVRSRSANPHQKPSPAASRDALESSAALSPTASSRTRLRLCGLFMEAFRDFKGREPRQEGIPAEAIQEDPDGHRDTHLLQAERRPRSGKV